MYRILRIIGNNFVSAVSEKGETVVLQGLGIGFKQRKGFVVDQNKIERIFRMNSESETNKLTELVSNIPIEHISFVAALIDEVQLSYEEKLSPNIYITLTDHISFSIERFKNNEMYSNALLNEIKMFYSKEFNISKMIVEKINNHFDVNLPEDEAGFIALHLVNAQLFTSMTDMVKLTKIINSAMKIVLEFFPNKFENDSFQRSRFLSHLKYLAQGILNNRLEVNHETGFDNLIEKKYPLESECVLKIRKELEREYECFLDDDELLMIAIQLHKLK